MPCESSDTPPAFAIRTMLADVFAFDRRRVMGALGLSAAASLAEGVGLALLAPILVIVLGADGAGGMVSLWGHTLPFAVVVTGALLIFAIAALGAIWMVWQRTVIVSALKTDFIADLSQRSHAALLGLSPGQMTGQRRTELTHLVTVDVGRAGQGAHFLFTALAQALRIPALFAVALAMSPLSALCAAFLLIAVILLARPYDRAARRDGGAMVETGQRMLARADESLASLTLIKTHKAESRWIDRYNKAATARFGTQNALAIGQARARAVAMAGGVGGLALIVWITLVMLGGTLAETTILVLALSRLLPAVIQFHGAWRSLIAAAPAHGRVNALLAHGAQHRESPIPPASQQASGPAALSLHRVAIARLPGEAPVVPEATLDLVTGGITAVMGPSGAGKSTLALGVSGLLPLEGGAVHLDGRRLDGSARLALRRAAVIVPQDPILFDDTVAANLRLAKPDAQETALWQALEAAAVADVVRRLPQGLETRLGERATRLSGGESQRLALAQALLAAPRLLILDEATSALDGDTQERVMASLLALRGKSTMLLVTHRPALAQKADAVITMHKGHLITGEAT